MIRIAAFDVDGTLTKRDCVVPFLRRVAGTRSIATALARSARSTGPALLRRDRDRLKALAVDAAFTGRSVSDVRRMADDFAAEVFATGLRPDKWAALSRHVAAGDQVVLVSASFEVYLRPLAERLGAHDVLAARLEHDEVAYTGRLDGANCRGAEKVRRLHAWLDEHHGGRSNAHVTAYGDSTGDRELLWDADEPRYVGSGSPAWLPVGAHKQVPADRPAR